MEPYGTLKIVVLGVCLAVSFLLSGMEAGVFALSRLRIRQSMRAGNPRASVLHGYLENPENFLWTIMVGNTVANFIAVSLVVAELHGRLHQWPVWFLFELLGVVFMFYAFCDLLPKTLFRQYPNRLCLALAGPFRFIHLGVSPLVSLMAWLASGLLRWTGGKVFTGHLFGNREELRMVMQESAQGLTSEERSMINRVLDLQNLTVRQITIPLAKAVTVDSLTPMSEVLQLCRERQIDWLPVWRTEKNRRNIVGSVSLRTLLYQAELDVHKTAGEYVKPALYLDEDLRLENALRLMQRSGHRLAVVLGRARRETGIVSLQDILKAIFGEVSL